MSRTNLQQACDALIASQQSLLLATRGANGDAELSYAPFVCDERHFYIFISELAKHTQNLRSHPHASVMLIEPESEAKNIFARQRLTLNCLACEVPVSDARYASQLQALQRKFGGIVELLQGLPDFYLMSLAPCQGLYVAGFGKAIAVDDRFRLQENDFI